MYGRIPAIGIAVLCTLIVATSAQAQLTSACLRPLAIPDKWVEHQGSPDAFDIGGANPDVYIPERGYNVVEDDGTYVSLYLASTTDSRLYRNGFLWVALGGYGSVAILNSIVSCVGVPFTTGDLLPLENAGTGPIKYGFSQLIASDPTAAWDPVLKRVVNSSFAQSPRVIALPVFDPEEYAVGLQNGTHPIRIVKIVGFFVESLLNSGAVNGYLTAHATLTALPTSSRGGEGVTLSARLETPGGFIGGIPIEFELFGNQVGAARTNEWDSQVFYIAPVDGSIAAGTYSGAIRARVADGVAFVNAAESRADFTLRADAPRITWPDPSAIVYGTALGSSQLNATGSVAGQFFYNPPAGTLLHAGTQVLDVTFVPDDSQLYAPTYASRFISVVPAPLTMRVAPASKLYLDPLPFFSLIIDGFVNGDTSSRLSGARVFQTSATASSPVGLYPVSVSGLSSRDYAIDYEPGTLEVLPRPIATLVSPPNGATDVDVMQPITWTSAPVDCYYLYVGTTAGANDIVNTGEIQQTSFRAPLGLPGGMTLYARLWTRYAGAWTHTDTTFTTSPIARLMYPTNGATIIDPTQPLTWNPVPAAQAYYLYVGSSLGAKDVVNTGEVQQTTYLLRNTVPINQLLYARLWTKLGGLWRYSDTTFSLVPLVAVMTSPVNGAVNVDLSLPVQWTTIASAEAYYLYIGSTRAANDLVNSGEIQGTSYVVRTALPSGQTMYARLFTRVAGVWRFTDSTFTAIPVIARFTYPAAASTTIDPAQPLAWTAVANAQAYYLYVGSTLGAKDLVNTGELQQTSYLLRGLPADQTLYARLWTKVNGLWRFIDTTFLVR